MTRNQFELLMHRHQDRVYGYASTFLRDSMAAADVTQEVFVKLWRHRESIEPDRVLGWLLHVARNACIDVARHRQMRRRVLEVDSDQLGEAPSAAPSPAAATEAADFDRLVQQALDQLAEPYRSIVILREMQGLAYDEISGAMDLPLNTVKVYLHRGRKKLRDTLAPVLERDTV